MTYKTWLKYAMSLYYYIKIVPIPTLEAFVLITNNCSKSEKVKISPNDNVFLRVLKVY